MSEKRAMWHCVNYELNVWMCTGKNGCGGEIALAQGTPKNYGMKFCPYCGMKMTQRKPDEKMRSVDAEIEREFWEHAERMEEEDEADPV